MRLKHDSDFGAHLIILLSLSLPLFLPPAFSRVRHKDINLGESFCSTVFRFRHSKTVVSTKFLDVKAGPSHSSIPLMKILGGCCMLPRPREGGGTSKGSQWLSNLHTLWAHPPFSPKGQNFTRPFFPSPLRKKRYRNCKNSRREATKFYL